MEYFERALHDGHAELLSEGRQVLVLYKAAKYTARYTPSEHVRAEFWAELIYKYGYSPTNIAMEVAVGSEKTSQVDMLVYRNDGQKQPFVVVECKDVMQSGIEFQSAQEQVRRYVAELGMTSGYGVVAYRTARNVLEFSGNDNEDGVKTVADLPVRYGQPKEFRYYKGIVGEDSSPASVTELLTAFSNCLDAIWGGGRISRTVAFDELCKILSLKILDEAVCVIGQPYSFQTKSHETDRALSERIRTAYEDLAQRRPAVLDETIGITDSTLRTVVAYLEGINITETSFEAKREGFEALTLRALEREPSLLTARSVIRFAVEMVGVTGHEMVLDPACGTGGFLTCVLEKVRNEALRTDTAKHEQFGGVRLVGLDIDRLAVRIARVYLLLSGAPAENVHLCDALMPFKELMEDTGIEADKFDVVLTNPPWGREITSAQVLDGFSLGIVHSGGKRKVAKGRPVEALFVERTWQFLKPGGRAAIILPDYLLRVPAFCEVRKWILDRFSLTAVVKLPQSRSFWSTPVTKGYLVILKKRPYGDIERGSITFMAEPTNNSVIDTEDGLENYFKEVARVFFDFFGDDQPLLTQESVGLARCFALPESRLGDRLDPDYHRPDFQALDRLLRTSFFPTKTLGDLEVVSSVSLGRATPKQHEYSEHMDDPVFLRVQDVKDGRFLLENAKRIPWEVFSAHHPASLSAGDVVLTIDGSRLGAAAVWSVDHPACISNHLVRIVPGPLVMSKYLVWFLNSELGALQIRRMTTEGIIPTLRPDAIKRILIPVPPLEVQHQIVAEVEAAHADYLGKLSELNMGWDRARVRFVEHLIGGEG